MASTWTKRYLGVISLFLYVLIRYTDAVCKIPEHFHGDFFSVESGGYDTKTIINHDTLSNDRLQFNGVCQSLIRQNSSATDALGHYNAIILFHDGKSNCYKCYHLLYRTSNVIQYKRTSCKSSNDMTQVCQEIQQTTEMETMFKRSPDVINCKTTFEGIYHFTYEIDLAGGGICDSSRSVIKACQEPGSPYVDNQVFYMNFSKCADVSTSVNENIRFQCLGSWRDDQGNVYAAVRNLGRDVDREMFRCMLTRDDQQRSDNKRRYTLSRWAMCSSLKSPYDGPYRLVLTPALPIGSSVVHGQQVIQPTCNLPRNFTGNWFTTGEYDTAVYINSTHIYFKTKIDQYYYKETYFTCVMNRDSRYLMSAVTVGKCEVDYICFDFVPRHHNVVRWRMGKPYRVTPIEMNNEDYLFRKFRQSCTWSSFTFDRNNVEWKYETFLLDPPAPVDCPISGRYDFVQIGQEEEKYHTRIRGITERPRHHIDCRRYETEFKVCSDNPKKMMIDAEYCSTLDHTGRPIGEYDVADNILTCVGFWMEDMRSYLITYDEEDPVSKFRCWVYERTDWRNMMMSRATRAKCGWTQTANSYTAKDGASLALALEESERLFDECPQQYNDGNDPFEQAHSIYVLAGSSSASASLLLTMLAGAALWVTTMN